MTTGVLCPVPILQFFDNTGKPAVGGSILTQVGGVNAATYSDVNLTTPLPNPIPLNSRGEASTAAGATAQVFLTPNTIYVFTISDAAGNVLDTPQYVDGIQLQITQALIGAALYPQTAAEIAVGVAPTNYAYPPGNVFRYGAVGNNIANDTAAIQAAINQSGQPAGAGAVAAFLPACTGYAVSSSLALVQGGSLVGAGMDTVNINSSAAAVAFDGYTTQSSSAYFYMAGFTLNTSNAACVAFHLGNDCRQMRMDRVSAYGPVGGATVACFKLDPNTPNVFSGGLLVTGGIFEFYYYGVQDVGGAGNNQWTTYSFIDCYLLGPSSAAGSIGIWLSSTSNGVGSHFEGGTIESFAKPFQFDNGCSPGVKVNMDIESNTNPGTFGASFSGYVYCPASSTNQAAEYWQDANASANIWARRQNKNGALIEEQYASRYHIILSDSGSAQVFAIRAGTSLILGNSPAYVGGVAITPGALSAPANNYMFAPNGANVMAWGSATPIGARVAGPGGNWAVGDIIWNTGVTSTTSPGWVCTTAGAPGTWTAMPNL